jgi:tetratricopeptide (TPR) repeat protein
MMRNIILFAISLLFFSCGSDTKSDLTTLQGLDQAILNDPSNPELWHNRGKIYLEKQQADSALINVREAIRLDSSKANYYITLGDIYLVSNRTRYTRQALERAVKLEPSNQTAHMKLAELYLYVEMRKESLNEINEVLRLDKRNPKAYYLKGIVYKELGDTNLAVSSFMTATEQDQQYGFAFEQLGLLYAAKHDFRALDFYKNALKINPKNTLVRYNIAYFLQQEGQIEKAIEAYKELIRIDPNYSNAYYNLGFINLEIQNKPEEALNWFETASKVNPGYAEAIYMKGLCYERLKKRDLAIADYQKSLVVNPRFELAKEGLERLGVKISANR